MVKFVVFIGLLVLCVSSAAPQFGGSYSQAQAGAFSGGGPPQQYGNQWGPGNYGPGFGGPGFDRPGVGGPGAGRPGFSSNSPSFHRPGSSGYNRPGGLSISISKSISIGGGNGGSSAQSSSSAGAGK